MKKSIFLLILFSVTVWAKEEITLNHCGKKVDEEAFLSSSTEKKILIRTGVICLIGQQQCQQQQQNHYGQRKQTEIDNVKIIQDGEVVRYNGNLYACRKD